MPGCYAIFHKQLGDVVLLEPTLSKLRDHCGEPIRMVTRGGHAALLQLMRGVRFVKGPAMMPKGTLYAFDTLHKTALRAVFAPVLHRRAVFASKSEMSWWHAWIYCPITVPELKEEYVAKYYWDNTHVPASEPFRPPQLSRPPEDWRMPLPLRDYILCNPTAGWKMKCWTTGQWAKFLQAIHDRTGLPIVIVGGSNEWQLPHCREVAEQCGASAHCVAGETSLKNFLWFAANAKMVLSVDGSASHLAGAFGIPCLTLFGGTSVANWHWPTARSVALRAPMDEKGERKLRNLPMETVMDAAEKLWASVS